MTITQQVLPFKPYFDAAYAKYPAVPRGVLEALAKRESNFTDTPDYKTVTGKPAKGRADGTGDWAPRHGRMPPGGGGFGRGLMQIDDDAHYEFCTLICEHGIYAWACFTCNVMYAAGVLNDMLRLANGYLPEAVCAYNAGWGGVKKARATLTVCEETPIPALDAQTEGGNYVSYVLHQMQLFNQGE